MAPTRQSRSKASASTATTRPIRATAQQSTEATITPPPAPSQNGNLNAAFIPISSASGVIGLESLAAINAPSRVEYLPAGYIPRRPNNPFFWYSQMRKRQNPPSHKGQAQCDVLKMYGQEWKELEALGLQGPYINMEAAERRVYAVRFPGYRYAGGAKDRMSRTQWKKYAKKNKIRVPCDWSLETDHLFVLDANGAVCFQSGESPAMLVSDSDDSPAPETPTDEFQSFDGYPYPTCFEAIQYQPSLGQYPSSSSSSSPSFSLSPSPSLSPGILPQPFPNDQFNPYTYPPFEYNYDNAFPSDAPYLAGSSHIDKQPTSPPHINDSLLVPFAEENQPPSTNVGFDAFYADVDFASAFDGYSLSL